MRTDGRADDELRPLSFERDFTEMAAGSCLVTFGRTRVLCTASLGDGVPPWLRNTGRGWVTAEYSMLPGSSNERIRRRTSGRDQEIQRLIARSLRAVVDLEAMPEVEVTVDCDVLQADGGTRTTAISGAWVALHDLFKHMDSKRLLREWPLEHHLGAVSVGVIDGEVMSDICYEEDSRAEVDMNIIMTSAGEFVEVQGAAEGATFSRETLDQLLATADASIRQIFEAQKAAVEED